MIKVQINFGEFMSSALTIYAGTSAFHEIKKHGISPEQIKVLAGAAGGPKWFTLYGLDQYLFGEFFPQKQDVLETIGASAGAWRMACLAQADPVSAIDRLAKHYSEECYSDNPSAAEITSHAIIMLDKVLGENGAVEIINNKKIHSHFVTNRSKGLLTCENPPLLITGLILSAFLNMFSRSTMQYFFERVVFHSSLKHNRLEHNGLEDEAFFKLDSFPTINISLTQQNLKKALLASGSIPVVLEGIKDIPGAPKGIYRDGGITDYHFDFPFLKEPGLVLYPHFSRTVLPGWFDKKIPWRKITPAYYHNVILVVPSEDHVAKLPFGKISDRNDFKNMADKNRIQYFNTVLSESQRLGEEFRLLVETGKGIDKILPLFPA